MTGYQRQELMRIKRIIDDVLRLDIPADIPGLKRLEQICESNNTTVIEMRSHRRMKVIVDTRAAIMQQMHKEGWSIRALCKLFDRTTWGVKHLLRK